MQFQSRITVWTMTLATFICVAISGAFAKQPTVEYTPFGDSFVLAAAESGCSFDVLVEPLAVNQKTTTFYDKLGQLRYLIVTGKVKLRLTNQSSGRSIDINSSGPGRLYLNEDGSISIFGGGTSLLYSGAGTSLPAGFPRFALVKGRVEFTVGADNSILAVTSLNGNTEDLCVTLSQ